MPMHRLQAHIDHLRRRRFLQAKTRQKVVIEEQSSVLTAVTRLDTYARTSGSTISLLPSASSMMRALVEMFERRRDLVYLTRL